MSFIPAVSLGENSRIVVGGNNLLVQSGTARENPQEIPTGCNMTAGFTTRTRGFYNLEVSAKCQWTVAENPFTNPPALQPGAEVGSPVSVYPDILNDPGGFYLMPVCWCVDATCNIESGGTGGVISFDLSLKNQGEYFTPAYPQA